MLEKKKRLKPEGEANRVLRRYEENVKKSHSLMVMILEYIILVHMKLMIMTRCWNDGRAIMSSKCYAGTQSSQKRYTQLVHKIVVLITRKGIK